MEKKIMKPWKKLSLPEKTEYRNNRLKYIGQICTLNDKLAMVQFNWSNGFASIDPLDPKFGGVEFSWSVVYNIIDNHKGKF